MTREEAINHIWDLTLSVQSEFCCSTEEREALTRETEEAIAALGVNTNE